MALPFGAGILLRRRKGEKNIPFFLIGSLMISICSLPISLCRAFPESPWQKKPFRKKDFPIIVTVYSTVLKAEEMGVKNILIKPLA